MKFVRATSAAVSLSMLMQVLPAFAASFSDVPENSTYFAAAEFLKSNGIMQGYADGTFKPNQKITRAEVIKLLVASKMTAEEIATFTNQTYTDVPPDAWFHPFVEAALNKLGLIDGPSKTTTFSPARTINQAEFLKLLFKSQGADTNAFSEIALPLATDVADSSAWFYPLMRYALSSAVLQVETDGMLRPAREMTRGNVAQQMYHFAMYQAGKRTQALLSEEENELVNVLTMIEEKNIEQAIMASARALVVARGAHLSKPSIAIVQAAVKIAESFRSIVRAYVAGSEGKLQDVIMLSKEAWNQAENAKKLSPGLSDLVSRVQTIAQNMANQARGMLQEGAPAKP